jgi:hypothetical protein
MADVQSIADYKVTIKGASYSMLAVPEPSSPIVKDEILRVLRGLNLDDVVHGLKQAEFLVWCAYNGVAGNGELRAEVANLQHNLLNTCQEAKLALDNFEDSTQDILKQLPQVFEYLVKGQAEIALDCLAECAEQAGRLATEARTLAGKFSALADKTGETRDKTQRAEGVKEDEASKLAKEKSELDAQIAESQQLLDDLRQRCQELQKKVNQAHDDMEEEAKRSFELALTKAIMEPIAAGIGAFASAFAMKQGMAPPAPVQPSPLGTGSDSPISSGDPLIGQQATGGSSNPSDGMTSSSTANPVTNPGTSTSAAPTGMAGPATKTATGPQQSSDTSQAKSGSAREVFVHLLDLQQQVEDERIRQAGLMAKYAVQLSSKKSGIEAAKIASNALHIAVGALRQVEVALMNASSFWQQMQAYCERLSDAKSGVAREIKRHAQNEKPEGLAAFFATNERIKADIVIYYARWRAVNVLVAQYAEDSAKTYDELGKHMRANPNTEESTALASELGAQLQSQMVAVSAEAQKRKDEALAERKQLAA